PPEPLTQSTYPITHSSATRRGKNKFHGDRSSDLRSSYPPTSEYGQSAPCAAPPGEGTSPAGVSAAIASLSANGTYHFRLVAKNADRKSAVDGTRVNDLSHPPFLLNQVGRLINQTGSTTKR